MSLTVEHQKLNSSRNAAKSLKNYVRMALAKNVWKLIFRMTCFRDVYISARFQKSISTRNNRPRTWCRSVFVFWQYWVRLQRGRRLKKRESSLKKYRSSCPSRRPYLLQNTNNVTPAGLWVWRFYCSFMYHYNFKIIIVIFCFFPRDNGQSAATRIYDDCHLGCVSAAVSRQINVARGQPA